MDNERLIKLPDLCTLVGKKRSSVYEAINRKSRRYDPTFPLPLRVGARGVAWRLSEVQAWVRSRPAAR